MKAGPVDEKYINIIIRETLTALGYLHKQGIIHRDIKGLSCSPFWHRSSLWPVDSAIELVQRWSADYVS